MSKPRDAGSKENIVPAAETDASTRKPYCPPRLIIFGSVTKLTGNSAGSDVDSMAMGPKVMTPCL
jgi:hypothetical protein